MSPGTPDGGRTTAIAGLAMTLFAYFTFSLHDAAVKWLVADHSVWVILFVRSVVLFLVCFGFSGIAVIRRVAASPVRGRLIVRPFVFLLAWFCYFTAARDLPLATLVTLYYAAPFIMAAMAIHFLGERVPASRWIAIAVGFTGVVIAAGPADFSNLWPVSLTVFSAAVWAYAMILVRQIARLEPTEVQMMASSLVLVVVCGLIMLLYWEYPGLPDLGLMILLGLLAAAGQFLIYEAIRRLDISVIGPLEFSSLAWAFILGYLIWGDVPTAAVFAGAALILVSGVMVVRAGRGG